jgi:hypothetical protein
MGEASPKPSPRWRSDMRERLRICEVPLATPIFLPSRRGLSDAICYEQIFINVDAVGMLRRDGAAA